jgi:hypothetical protein
MPGSVDGEVGIFMKMWLKQIVEGGCGAEGEQ